MAGLTIGLRCFLFRKSGVEFGPVLNPAVIIFMLFVSAFLPCFERFLLLRLGGDLDH